MKKTKILMKEFFGQISFTGKASFLVKAKNISKAEEIVFDDIKTLNLELKDGSTLEITEIQWDLIGEQAGGNVSESYIGDFEIQEEK